MSTAKKRMVYKKLNEYKTIWHPESTLVFKSQKERLIIGRYVDGELISLDDEALDLCQVHGFTPDDSLLENYSGEETPPNNSDNESGQENEEKSIEQSCEEDDDENDKEELEEVNEKRDDEGSEELRDDEGSEDLNDKGSEELRDDEGSEDLNDDKESEELKDDEGDKLEINQVDSSKSKQECMPVIEMCSDLLNTITQKENDLRNFLISVQKNLDEERSNSQNLSITLSETKSKLEETVGQLNSLQEKYDVIKKKFDTMKSIFA